MGFDSTPRANRLHIGIFGKRNVHSRFSVCKDRRV